MTANAGSIVRQCGRRRKAAGPRRGRMVAVPRPLKITIAVAGVLVVVLIVGLIGVVWTVHRPFPQTYASTASDLFFAQGYVQSQDRFFEMDFRRHLTSGTLSELFGRTGLETD